MKTVECAGGIVLNPKNEVLVVTNQLGKHTLPKGTRKPSETALENALREVTEESGLTRLEVVKYLGVLVRPGHTADNGLTPSVIKRIDIFHFNTEQYDLCPAETEIVEARWIALDGLVGVLSWQEEIDFVAMHEAELFKQ